MTNHPNRSKIRTTEAALAQAETNIRQLCDMVNDYSVKLGLGRKVRAEDFLGPLATLTAARFPAVIEH